MKYVKKRAGSVVFGSVFKFRGKHYMQMNGYQLNLNKLLLGEATEPIPEYLQIVNSEEVEVLDLEITDNYSTSVIYLLQILTGATNGS